MIDPSTDYQSIDLPMCQCRPFAELLIERGFFPTAPSQPNLAISIDFLELYCALFEQTGDAVTAIAAAMSKLYSRRGFPVVNKQVRIRRVRLLNTLIYLRQGKPIEDPFRKALSAAAQWYDCLRGQVRRSVDDAIEEARQKIQSAAGVAPDPQELVDEPSKPTYQLPSAHYCARLLQERCPACFGGRMAGRSFQQ